MQHSSQKVNDRIRSFEILWEIVEFKVIWLTNLEGSEPEKSLIACSPKTKGEESPSYLWRYRFLYLNILEQFHRLDGFTSTCIKINIFQD